MGVASGYVDSTVPNAIAFLSVLPTILTLNDEQQVAIRAIFSGQSVYLISYDKSLTFWREKNQAFIFRVWGMNIF